MSFQQGLSGLNGAAKNLDVIGNNIANVSTAGFKQARTEFADVYANSLYGSGGAQVGIGTQVVNVSQSFTQGNITSTNNPLDVAVNGDGFFRVSDGGAIAYTRNGQFHLDKDGYLVTNTGGNITGYTTLTLDANNNVTGAADLGNIQIDLNDLEPQATSKISMVLSLDASATAPTTTPFDPNVAATYNFTTSTTIYDSLGASHTMQMYYVRDSTNPLQWKAYAYLDGTTDQIDLDGAGTNDYHTLTFTSSGQLASGATISGVSHPLAPAANLSLNYDFTGVTQFAGDSGLISVSQDGYARGRVVGVSIDNTGVIFGRYTNGLTRPLQQLVLASFRNPNALVSLGNNQWASNSETGTEVLNVPGKGVAGVVQSGATEDANVDLTAELVNLIVAQRLYQANAQTIRAQDQILQTLVNLR
ncbi:MAG: flagellar hook protein FlgE [Gallionellaceae bacterium]|nr:flagellar hook protein FlgE [Gallionellaceae bacterium]MDD5366225.1 flagellar hook protein FlgE [Gallionellaceae bacterium]